MTEMKAEELLSSKVGSTHFQDVKTLNLSAALKSAASSVSLKHVFSTLRKFTSLELLDLSDNELKHIPELVAPSLTSLDVSSNELTSVDFLKSLPSLTELKISPGNPGVHDQFLFLAVFYCKKLCRINGEAPDKYKAGLKALRKSLLQIVTEVHGMHRAEIDERAHEDGDQIPVLMNELWNLVRRRISDGKRTPHYPYLQEVVSREIIRKYLEEVSRAPEATPTLFETSERKKVRLRRRLCPPVAEYDPALFLRCHSTYEKKSDKETKIWRAAFQPGSHVVASCGGNYVCLIDCDAGKVLLKYKLLDEDFYSVAWSRMKIAESDASTWMLATSGFRGSVRLLRPDRMTCVLEVKHHKAHVNSLLFHPNDSQRLFTGSADQSICLWRFDPLLMPSHRTSFTMLMKFVVPVSDDVASNDVLNLLLRGSHLLAATENDFVCWYCGDIPDSVTTSGFSAPSAAKKSPKVARQRKALFQAELPYMSTEYSVMDGMTPLGSTPYVASKYYKDGVISIWDFDKTVEDSKRHDSDDNVDCHLVTRLKWSDTDELYINIGSSADGKLFLAGDDQGAIWMYNLDQLKIMGGAVEPIMQVGVEEEILHPSAVLEWPEVHSPSDSGLDLDFDEKKIMLNYLTISEDGKFIVGCTDVNIVCVWKVVTAAPFSASSPSSSA